MSDVTAEVTLQAIWMHLTGRNTLPRHVHWGPFMGDREGECATVGCDCKGDCVGLCGWDMALQNYRARAFRDGYTHAQAEEEADRPIPLPAEYRPARAEAS